MNQLELWLAIQEVLLAQSDQELALVLANNPDLFEIETKQTLMAIAQQARQDGMDKMADDLQMAVLKIVKWETFQNESSESQSSKTISSIKPKVAWAIKARHHLALLQPKKAIVEVNDEPEIAYSLKLLLSGNYDDYEEFYRLTEVLLPKLYKSDRHEEILTLNLFALAIEIECAKLSSEFTFSFENQLQSANGVKLCEKAIRIAENLDDTPCKALFLANLGVFRLKSQQRYESLNSLTEALEIYKALVKKDSDFNPQLGDTFHNVGGVLDEIGSFEDAEDSLTQALNIRQELMKHNAKFSKDVAMTLNNLGNVQSDAGKLQKASYSYTDALDIYEELGRKEPHIFDQNIANIYLGLGRVQQGMGILESLLLKAGVPVNSIEPYLIGKLSEAETSYTKALNKFKDLAERGDHIFYNEFVANKSFALMSAKVLNNIGHLQIELNKNEKAISSFEEAIKLIEISRKNAITIDDRNRILQENVNIYNGLLACYIRMKDWEKALEIAELGKSRSLSDLLNLKAKDLQPKATTPDTLAIVKGLGNKYSDAIKELQRLESYERYLSEQLNRLNYDIKQIKDDAENDDDTRQGFLRQIAEEKQPLEEEKRKAQDQRFAVLTELRSVLDEIKNYDKDFPPKAKDINGESIYAISKNLNRTIVMFRILSESTAVIFVFPLGELHIEEIKGFGQNEMFELFRDKWLIPYLQWKDKMAEPGVSQVAKRIELDKWKAAIEQTLDTIYKKLMIKVHKVLKDNSDQVLKDKLGNQNILFVPNQSLALLPLHAASWKDEVGKKHYLLEDYSISYAPSVSVFKRCQENEKQRSNKTLFVTNPKGDLDSSEQEVSFIERLHQPSKNLLRKDATKSAVIEELRDDYGFTHFSCHGFYHQQSPFDSGLVMSDEVIKLSEIINSNLQNNWLTTLSACETGMVDFASPTDEHFGLPLGFIFAGSPSVWASLWSVSDLATSELMQKAYENLSTEKYKDNKPEALRQAQLSMLSDRDSAHPFFWAGFQHFGV